MFYSKEKKLNFKDVLIVPKLSKLNSRKDVFLDTKIIFPVSGINWEGVPIMASNMDYVGTFEMGLSLQKFHMTNAVSKFYSLDAWINSINKGLDLNVLPQVQEHVKHLVAIGEAADEIEKV